MFTQVGFRVLWSTARSASDFHMPFSIKSFASAPVVSSCVNPVIGRELP